MDTPDMFSRFVPNFDILFLSVKETDTAYQEGFWNAEPRYIGYTF